MVVPLPNGDVDISMLKEAVQLINGRYETEVFTTKCSQLIFTVVYFGLFLTINDAQYFDTDFIYFFITTIFFLLLSISL